MQQEQSSNVKFIRMNTGEDLLAEVTVDDKDEKCILVNPLKLVYLLGEKPGSMMLSLIEWIFPRVCSKQEFEVYTSDIITIANPTTDIVDYYLDAVTKLDNNDFKFDDDHDSLGKIKAFAKQMKQKEEEISPEEMEAFANVIDNLRSTKRKLH